MRSRKSNRALLHTLALCAVVAAAGCGGNETEPLADTGQQSFAQTGGMLRPIIQRPVYVTSSAVRIGSLELGTTVELYSGSDLLGSKQVDGGGEIVSVNRPLLAGEMLTARVVDGATQSDLSEAVEVADLPASLPMLDVEPIQYTGAGCIQVRGGLPGGKAYAFSGTELLGTCELTIDGACVAHLSRPLAIHDQLQFHYDLGGKQSPASPVIEPIRPIGPGRYAEQLPPPEVLEPLYECQTRIRIGSMMPGAEFTMSLAGVEHPGHCAPNHTTSFTAPQPLEKGHVISAKQRLANWPESEYRGIAVASVEELEPARVGEPVYEGATRISVTNQAAEAELTIFVDGTVAGHTMSGAGTEFDLGIELKAGQVVEAQLTLCGHAVDSNQVVVQGRPKIDPPKVLEPLYEGTTLVRVDGRVDGARVLVFADGVFMGEARAEVVPTYLMLQAGQKITARQAAGGLLSDPSDPVEVLPVERIPAPRLNDPVDSCGPRATLDDLLPGARVYLFAANLVIGSRVASDTTESMTPWLRPWPGWEVDAIQCLGAHQSPGSNTVTATGALAVTTWHGHEEMEMELPDEDVRDVRVAHCFGFEPVPEEVTITLHSTNTSVVNLLGPDQDTLMPNSWNAKADFQVQAHAAGTARLVAQAPHYRLTRLDWITPDGGLDVEVIDTTEPEENPVTHEHADISLYKVCPWQGACWMEGNTPAPVPQGTLTGFQNIDRVLYLWFATDGAGSRDACSSTTGTLLAPGDKIESTELGFAADQNMAVPYLIQAVPCRQAGQAYLDIDAMRFRVLYDLTH